MLQRLKKLAGFADIQVERMQDNIATVLDPISSVVFLDGNLSKGVKLLAASPNTVPHKLNRVYTGYHIAKQNANSVIWIDETVQSSPDRSVVLRCSADVTVDIWFY